MYLKHYSQKFSILLHVILIPKDLFTLFTFYTNQIIPYIFKPSWTPGSTIGATFTVLWYYVLHRRLSPI